MADIRKPRPHQRLVSSLNDKLEMNRWASDIDQRILEILESLGETVNRVNKLTTRSTVSGATLPAVHASTHKPQTGSDPLITAAHSGGYGSTATIGTGDNLLRSDGQFIFPQAIRDTVSGFQLDAVAFGGNLHLESPRNTTFDIGAGASIDQLIFDMSDATGTGRVTFSGPGGSQILWNQTSTSNTILMNRPTNRIEASDFGNSVDLFLRALRDGSVIIEPAIAGTERTALQIRSRSGAAAGAHIRFDDKTGDPPSPIVGELWRNAAALNYRKDATTTVDLTAGGGSPHQIFLDFGTRRLSFAA